MRRPFGLAAVSALALLAIPQPTPAQLPPAEHPVFGHTIMYGTGFLNTPNAFVPGKSTVYVTATGIMAEDAAGQNSALGRGAFGLGIGKFFEIGGSVLRTIDRHAGYAKLQILQQGGAFPAVAVGVHSLTTVDSVGRYGTLDHFREDIFDAASLYVVFTYVAGPGNTQKPSWVVLSGGWGTGQFLEDNPSLSDDGESAGIFGAVAFDFQVADQAFLRVALEHDGFDANAGITVTLAGLEVTLGVLSIDEGEAPVPLIAGQPVDFEREGAGFIYNQAKPFLSMTLDARALNDIPWIWTKKSR